MQETNGFPEQSTDDEINLIYDELFAVINAFSENGEGLFIVDFLRDYILTQPAVEIQEEIEGIIESLKEYEEEKNRQITLWYLLPQSDLFLHVCRGNSR